MNALADNPRAVIGSNEAPDFARDVTDRMARDFAEVQATVDGLLAEADLLPDTVEDDEIMGVFARIIVRLRDVNARLNAFRIKEKEPYLRGGEAVDTWFFGLMDKVARRDRKARPAVADVLQAKLDAYNQRKLAEEQARRRRIADEEARVARDARERAERERRQAEEARQAAERARSKAEEKKAVATEKEVTADAAHVDAEIAGDKAQESHIATFAKPADIVRTRVEDGGMVTMGTEPYAVVENSAALDKELLWPFINEDAKEKALRAWAKNTGYLIPMEGASIGKRPKSIVRR